MGAGGYLTWTAAFAEIYKQYGKRILPIEIHGNQMKIVNSTIFNNNPAVVDSTIDNLENYKTDFNLIPLNRPETNYCKLDTLSYAKHRYDKHIIQQILEFYGIEKSIHELKPRLYFTEQEREEIDNLVKDISVSDFVTIEPQSNNDYTCNREYPVQKWQIVVNHLLKNVPVVQVGCPRPEHRLKGVIDATKGTTFRTCAGIIGKSRVFMSSEGGLTHASVAVNTPAVVVITGYQHPNMVAYPCNTNLWIHKDHGPCGKKGRCNECWNAVIEHDEVEIIASVEKLLK